MFVNLSQYGKKGLLNTDLVSFLDLEKSDDREIVVMGINGKITICFETIDKMDEFVSNFTNVRDNFAKPIVK